MKLGLILILLIAIGLVGFNTIQFMEKKNEAEKIFLDAQAQLNKIQVDNKKTEDDINYYSDEANLEKELRSQLNYHLPDEKTIIVVPKRQ